MKKYQLIHDKQKFISSLGNYGKQTNKCELCKKWYKLPNSIFEPRDRICWSCECKERTRLILGIVMDNI